MALDAFINLGAKIKGETKDKVQKEKHDIDVLSWSWGLANRGSFHHGGGGGTGKSDFSDLTFVKHTDSASPAIIQHCATGEHIDKVALLLRKAGGKQEKYLEITLTKALISSVSFGSGGDDKVTETISINFAKVEYEYFTQDDKGITKSAGKAVYDIEANTKEG